MADTLSAVRSKYPSLGSHVDTLSTLAAQKQTHQLTGEISKFLDSAATAGMPGRELLEFFTGFISTLASRMSPLELVKCIRKCTSPADVDAPTVLALLDKYQAQIAVSKDASVLGRVLAAEAWLSKAKNVSEARTVVDSLAVTLSDPIFAHSVNAVVRGSYHLVVADVYLALSNDFEFYSNLVQFLTYTPLADIPAATLRRTTKQAAVIALIHPEIHDFGELLALPAFQHDAPLWTVDFLRAVHLGNFSAFQAAVTAHSAEIASEAQLFAQINTSLHRKLTMIALAELASFGSTNRRMLTFAQISEHCRVKLEEVEELVMTAMGAGRLVEGVIDEVDGTVTITAVKPRMLDEARMRLLGQRIVAWTEKSQTLVDGMANLVPELLVM